MIDPIKARVSIGNDRGEIRGSAIEITTPKGTFQFGVDNDGWPYVSSVTKTLHINPQASNRIRLEER